MKEVLSRVIKEEEPGGLGEHLQELCDSLGRLARGEAVKLQYHHYNLKRNIEESLRLYVHDDEAVLRSLSASELFGREVEGPVGAALLVLEDPTINLNREQLHRSLQILVDQRKEYVHRNKWLRALLDDLYRPRGQQQSEIVVPLDSPEFVGPKGRPESLRAELQKRLAALEATVEALSLPSPGLGHNNPPGAIDAAPYTSEDKAEILAAIAELKAQPVSPTGRGEVAIKARNLLDEKRGKLLSWFARQADNFATEFAKESGKELAKLGSRAILLLFIERILDVSTLVTKWLAAHGIS